ncbi:hypothetical protein F5880DRAFT_1493584, partial [Lentinula raphanica]
MSQPIPRPPTKGPSFMPAPGSTRAPEKFRGDASMLKEFLEDFEADAAAQELTDEEKVRMVLKYVDSETKGFWKTMEGYESKDWEKLKKELMHAYPEAKKSHRYTKKSLKKIAEANKKHRFDSQDDFSRYYRQFQNISKVLKADRRITEDEINTHFWKGIHKTDRGKILRRIELKDPDFD